MRYIVEKLTCLSILAALFLMAAAVSGPQVAMARDSDSVRQGFSELAEAVSPSVVNIRTEKVVRREGTMRRFGRNPFGEQDPFHEFFERFFGDEMPRDFKQRSLGSGFIIDEKGYIVTNNHVVANADDIKVALEDEREFDAEVIGRDPQTDIALIKIKAAKDLPAIPIGDSDALEVGDWVVAVGNPFGLAHTVTAGIVSAKGRVIGAGPYDDFIQTDASINPGNSGGPLINMQGEVVGINTMIVASGQGIGFAIPINLSKGILEQLKDKGEVTRGWLGVAIQDLNKELAEYYGLEQKEGALVGEVFPGDPADAAGIKPKDIIIEVDGEQVTGSRDLTNRVANLSVGDTVEVKAVRDGRVETFEVKIGKRPAEMVAGRSRSPQEEEGLGLQVSELDENLAQRFGIPAGRGVVVVNVEADSKADSAGIQRGDVIVEINREEINSVPDFRRIIDDADRGETLAFLIKRRNAGLAVVQLTK